MHDRILWPTVEQLARYLVDLADEEFDEVSKAKYEGDAAAILGFIKSEVIVSKPDFASS